MATTKPPPPGWDKDKSEKAGEETVMTMNGRRATMQAKGLLASHSASGKMFEKVNGSPQRPGRRFVEVGVFPRACHLEEPIGVSRLLVRRGSLGTSAIARSRRAG